jgi:tRNA(Ile)-lysidine synthase
MILSAFEHKFLRVHQNYFSSESSLNPGQHFFLGISGGIDSMVLLYLFHKFKNQMKCAFRVCYVHHGLSEDSAINQFRDKSLKNVFDFCLKNDIEFITNSEKPTNELISEQVLRKFRYEQFDLLKSNDEILVLGHHLDDLLESKLMDLIRGSHFEHWESHKELSGRIYRPLSFVSKDELTSFAVDKVTWVEDPTNEESDALRNWIRNGFLMELKYKSSKYKENLMRNLTKLYEFQPVSKDIPVLEISYQDWMVSTIAEKKQFVLKTGIELGLKSMTQGQILDIIKKLDLGRKDIKFQTGPIFWTKTADRLHAYRRSHEE